MERTIYRDFAQNSRLWDLVRMGMPTTSCFGIVMRTKGRGANNVSLTRDRYMRCLIAELMNGQPTVNYKSRQMERGHEQQDEAINAYLATYPASDEVVIESPAFITAQDGILLMGCSPDRYIKTTQQGGAEIKTLEGHMMVEILENPDVPAEHLPQLYGSMLVTGAEWWDFVAYSPGFRLFKKRLFRDHAYINDLEAGVRLFTRELEQRLLKISGETLTTHRRRHMERFAEAVAEEQTGGIDAKEVADGSALAGHSDGGERATTGIVSDLQASVQREEAAAR